MKTKMRKKYILQFRTYWKRDQQNLITVVTVSVSPSICSALGFILKTVIDSLTLSVSKFILNSDV